MTDHAVRGFETAASLDLNHQACLLHGEES